MKEHTLHIGWTTTETREQADSLARSALQARLVACAQVSGPLVSHYCWQGALERSEEYRVVLKFTAPKADLLEEWILANHPYDTPQWVTWPAGHVSADYLEWARRACE